MYEAVTEGIRVAVVPQYLAEQSKPDAAQFVWAYTIVIENLSNTTVQLKSRYWRITDALGRVQEVRGDGVVGEQPVLQPGERFEYTSGAPLPTPSGFMAGSYQMIRDGGILFEVTIPAFSLDSPDERPRVH